MTEIVKVQRPIDSNAAPWLIYDRAEKNIEHKLDASIPDAVKAAMGDDLKAFFKATWSDATGWTLGARVGNRRW